MPGITVAPLRRRLGLCWGTDPEQYIDAAAVVGFLDGILLRLRSRVIVVWEVATGQGFVDFPADREWLALGQLSFSPFQFRSVCHLAL